MAEIKIDPEAVREVGWLFGALANAFLQGFEEGFEDYECVKTEDEIKTVHETEEGLKQPKAKTEIGDCRKCWCDRCKKLETCEKTREGELPDGIRPFPCLGCENGMRFMPIEEAPCEDFEQGEGLNNG